MSLALTSVPYNAQRIEGMAPSVTIFTPWNTYTSAMSPIRRPYDINLSAVTVQATAAALTNSCIIVIWSYNKNIYKRVIFLDTTLQMGYSVSKEWSYIRWISSVA